MKKWILLLGVLLLIPAGRVEAANLRITLQLVAGDLSSDHPTVRATLTNLGREPISAETARLPWGNRYSITMVAVSEHSKYEQPIPLVFPIDDLLPGDVEIKPGESLQGSIRLDGFFKDIVNTLRKGPLLLLWSYVLDTNDGKQSERLAGALTLRQTPRAATH